MKTLTSILLLLLLSSMSFAQDYTPFSESTSKRFFSAGNATDNNFFFHATSTNILGDSTIFDQYYTKQNDGIPGEQPSGCIFWGGTTDERLDTTWLGNQLNWNAVSRELALKNEASVAIVFDFNLSIGSSAQFYSDGTTNYFIEHTATNLESFLGVSDSVQIYTVSAFDNVGSPASSALNNFEIRLSKNYGLLSFINCYDFPSVQQGYELQGQTNPLIGTYQLTYDEAYPWQLGDVLQYYSSNTPSGGFPKYAYHTLTVTDRTETVDSVIITYDALVQETNTSLPSSWIYGINYDPIRYKKGDAIWEKPWNFAKTAFEQNIPDVNASEESISICSTNRQFVTRESFINYCDSCMCYGSYDGFGTSVHDRFYTENLGIHRYVSTAYGPITGFNGAELVYWNVNGEECGTFWNSQDELFQFDLSIAPNPTKDIVKIEADQQIESIRVLDLSGRIIYIEKNINQKMAEISLASFQKGAYILEVAANGSTQKQTIIRE